MNVQILLLRLYGRRNRLTSSVDTSDDSCPISADKPAASDFVDPLDGLDDSTKETFQVSCRRSCES